MKEFPHFFKSPHSLAGADAGSPILVGLSGGADSTVLLRLLHQLQGQSPFPLYAAHINHGIRGAEFDHEAMRDEAFCRTLCEKLDISLFVLQADIPTLAAERGQSLESTARDVRYEFFATVMKDRSIPILATAHNASDNLETQIFNLCRGCGIDGLSGIPEVRKCAGGTLVRPILTATKQEILQFCHENGIDYMTDSTNAVADCTRNAIRLKLVPELQRLFGDPEAAGTRLAFTLREDADFLKKTASALLSAGDDELTAAELSTQHPAIAKRVLKLKYAMHSEAGLEEVHLSAMWSLIKSDKSGSISLPGNMRMQLASGRITFEQDHTPETTVTDYEEALLEGLNPLNGTDYAVVVSKNGELPIPPVGYVLFGQAQFSETELSHLTARNRRKGDTILDNGMHKKVKKLLCDKKLPQEVRDALPLICEDDDVLYVPGVALCDKARKTKRTDKITVTVYKKI